MPNALGDIASNVVIWILSMAECLALHTIVVEVLTLLEMICHSQKIKKMKRRHVSKI